MEKVDSFPHVVVSRLTQSCFEQRIGVDMPGVPLIAAGLGIAVTAFGLRAIARRVKPADAERLQKLVKNIASGETLSGSKYYKGGFEKSMSRREASLILGISPSSSANRVKQAHKTVMLRNHPDRGGSPFLAAKINQAKEVMEKKS